MDDSTTSVLGDGDLPPDVADGLRIARALIDAGIPVFAAPPCPSGPFRPRESALTAACTRPGHQAGGVEYDLPAAWQQTVPAHVWLERWRPGWALAAVGGWTADFADIDPRNGGDTSFAEMVKAGQWPTVFGVQRTPSGGEHHLISPTGERKSVGFLPGLDLQAGDVTGQGRGFVWIAPTVKRSKTDGQAHAYRWTQEPDLEWLAEFSRDPVTGTSADGSIEGIRLRVAAARERRADGMRERRERDGSRPRDFTPMQMLEFLAPIVERVEKAQIGEIEEQANALACALSHFVPAMLTEDQAYGMLLDALGETAYDPDHPASGWEASKFLAVISDVGGRAPGDWHAVPGQPAPGEMPIEDAVAAVPVEGDAVSALLAEMVTADELAAREPPRHMIEGLLQFDSESWVIGEPGSRKSFVVLDMAAHVAGGRPWQGRRVNQALVVFIVAEGAGGSSLRIKAWQKRYGDMGGNIRFLPRPVQAARAEAWAVLVQACARLSRVAAEAGQGVLVVLDTQARVTVGLKENDATDMGIFIDAVRAIREASGACVLTVHHTGRKGGDARGSSAIDGAQTTELKVVKDVGSAGGLYGKVITEKQKDITEAEPVPLKFDVVDLGQDADGRPLDSLVVAPDGSWRAGEVDAGTLDEAGQKVTAQVTPFAVRAEPQEWTNRLTHPNAAVQRWLLQALADVTGDRGLTQSEWRGLVEEKTGKLDSSSWRTAFQRVTDSFGKAVESGVVMKIHGADRWTADQVSIEALN